MTKAAVAAFDGRSWLPRCSTSFGASPEGVRLLMLLPMETHRRPGPGWLPGNAPSRPCSPSAAPASSWEDQGPARAGGWQIGDEGGGEGPAFPDNLGQHKDNFAWFVGGGRASDRPIGRVCRTRLVQALYAASRAQVFRVHCGEHGWGIPARWPGRAQAVMIRIRRRRRICATPFSVHSANRHAGEISLEQMS